MPIRQPLPPKMRQRPLGRTLFRQITPRRPPHGLLPLPHHAQLPHPQRHRRVLNPRARRPRPPIPMRAMTCPRWPITTWKACDRTRFPVTRQFRRYPRQEIATNNTRSGKDGPASPRSPAGRRCPQGVVQEPRVKTNPRGVPFARLRCRRARRIPVGLCAM